MNWLDFGGQRSKPLWCHLCLAIILNFICVVVLSDLDAATAAKFFPLNFPVCSEWRLWPGCTFCKIHMTAVLTTSIWPFASWISLPALPIPTTSVLYLLPTLPQTPATLSSRPHCADCPPTACCAEAYNQAVVLVILLTLYIAIIFSNVLSLYLHWTDLFKVQFLKRIQDGSFFTIFVWCHSVLWSVGLYIIKIKLWTL